MNPPPNPVVPRLAVVGASGFIGLRAVELLAARDDCTVVPIVRGAASLAVLARQRLDEAQALSLRQLVTTWQQLPAGYPAAANVSRGVLTNLLRAT